MLSHTLRFNLALGFSAAAFILILLALNVKPSDQRCLLSTSAWSPAADAVEYQWTTYQNDFADELPLFKAPSPGLELEWRSLQLPYYFQDSVVDGAANGRSASNVPKMTLEISHQLSCLNLLRQHTWREDYDYRNFEPFRGREVEVMGRIDGCVQYLREAIECVGDTTPYLIVMTSEKKSKEGPDFNTLHYCRNFDAIASWMKHHAAGGLQPAFAPNILWPASSREADVFAGNRRQRD